MDMGKLTTLVSDLALIGTAFYTGATISNDLVVSTCVAGAGCLLALLDAKYPEGMDTIKAIIKGIAQEE